MQLAQPLTEVDNLLAPPAPDPGRCSTSAGSRSRRCSARLVAGAAVLPLKRLTQATEHVALTQDLSGRIEPVGEDEIGRLARSFNAMLDALERSMGALDASVHAQRQLVADASHELRTPVTSLRTNIEILQHQATGDGRRRSSVGCSSEVVEQIEELTLLMNDLIDLARGEEPRSGRRGHAPGPARGRGRRARAPAHRRRRQLDLELEPTLVAGVARAAGAGGQQPDRQRRQVQPAGRAGRGRPRTGGS